QLVSADAGKCSTPSTGSQPSTVHGLPSSLIGAVPGAHEPAVVHSSSPLQALPSLQLAPVAGTWLTPNTASQASAVHGLASSRLGAAPVTQLPLPLQRLTPLQTSPSSQL